MLNNVPKTQTEQHPQLHYNIPTSSIFICITIHLVCYCSVSFCRCTNFKIQSFLPLWRKFIFEVWGWWSFYFVFSILGNSIIPPLVSTFSLFLLCVNFINIVTSLIVDFFTGAMIFIIMSWWWLLLRRRRVVWYGVRWLGWLGGTDDNTTPILSPSPFLVVYK